MKGISDAKRQREERLAQALRANLQRRKAQARGRRSPDDTDTSENAAADAEIPVAMPQTRDR